MTELLECAHQSFQGTCMHRPCPLGLDLKQEEFWGQRHWERGQGAKVRLLIGQEGLPPLPTSALPSCNTHLCTPSHLALSSFSSHTHCTLHTSLQKVEKQKFGAAEEFTRVGAADGEMGAQGPNQPPLASLPVYRDAVGGGHSGCCFGDLRDRAAREASLGVTCLHPDPDSQ